MGNIVNLILIVSLVLLLVSAGVEDARQRTIANWKNAAIALFAIAWWVANGRALWPDIALQVGVAAAVFGMFVLVFALGQMGGGDVKMIGALALWLPIEPLVWMLILMSLLGGALTAVLMLEKWLRKREGAIEIPYGVAIAMASLIALREPYLNHFG
ncbi:prepilin peptidase [Sphingomonas sp. SFZ2018-12]|uniref:A24 family peptidase n=1 Tax=Sphingomonas sp. SFZ2018-12 TaxID=2683197 RepID=UPI001F0E6EEE